MKYICKLHIIWNNFLYETQKNIIAKCLLEYTVFICTSTLKAYCSNMFLHFAKLSQKKWIVQIFFYPYYICIQQGVQLHS